MLSLAQEPAVVITLGSANAGLIGVPFLLCFIRLHDVLMLVGMKTADLGRLGNLHGLMSLVAIRQLPFLMYRAHHSYQHMTVTKSTNTHCSKSCAQIFYVLFYIYILYVLYV